MIKKIFDVIPAAMEGMDYATPFTIDSTKVLLAIRQLPSLLIHLCPDFLYTSL